MHTHTHTHTHTYTHTRTHTHTHAHTHTHTHTGNGSKSSGRNIVSGNARKFGNCTGTMTLYLVGHSHCIITNDFCHFNFHSNISVIFCTSNLHLVVLYSALLCSALLYSTLLYFTLLNSKNLTSLSSFIHYFDNETTSKLHQH